MKINIVRAVVVVLQTAAVAAVVGLTAGTVGGLVAGLVMVFMAGPDAVSE